jgi:hypothetical protein
VICGAQTLGYLVRRFGMEAGVAAYNYGSGDVAAVGDHLSRMPVETQNYVKEVIGQYDALQHETLEIEAPHVAAAKREPVRRFDALLADAHAGCSVLGEPQLFVPLVHGDVVANMLELQSPDTCAPQSAPAPLAQLGALGALLDAYKGEKTASFAMYGT